MARGVIDSLYLDGIAIAYIPKIQAAGGVDQYITYSPCPMIYAVGTKTLVIVDATTSTCSSVSSGYMGKERISLQIFSATG